MKLKNKHLIGLEGYPKQDINEIIETAFSFKEVLERPIKKVPSLQGKTILNLFFKKNGTNVNTTKPIIQFVTKIV